MIEFLIRLMISVTKIEVIQWSKNDIILWTVWLGRYLFEKIAN